MQATVGRGRYQLSHARQGLDRAGVAAGQAWQDLRSRPVRAALAAGGITLAAATVGAPLVAGATGAVLIRRAIRARGNPPRPPDSGYLKRADPTRPAPTTTAEAEK